VTGLPAKPEALQLLTRRFDAGNLRVQIAEVQHRLEELAKFEPVWEELVEKLRPLIQALDGKFRSWPPDAPHDRPNLLLAENLRLDLRSRLSTVFQPYPKDPLGKFLSTTFRIWDQGFFDLVGAVIDRNPDGSLDQEIRSEKFETMVGECRSIIAEHRRDLQDQLRRQGNMLSEAEGLGKEAERALKDERGHELAKVGAAATPTFREWVERKQKSWPWKFVWPFVEKPLRNLLWPILVAAVVGVTQWLRQHTP
jgi:hypothetical protein